MFSNEYQVRAQVGNGTIVQSLTKEYDPSFEGSYYLKVYLWTEK